MFAFDRNTPYPSLYTLIPTIGAALIILSANDRNLVGRLLGGKLIVGIGLISYSTYLWHQPLFAFAKYAGIHDGSLFLGGLLAMLSLVMGYLSWRFIEKPFLKHKGSVSSERILFFGALGSLFFIAVGVIGYSNKGFDSRLSEQDKAIAKWENYDYAQIFRLNRCLLGSEDTYRAFKEECYGQRAEAAYLIWGDSYAAASVAGIGSVQADIIQLTASACPPVIDKDFSRRPNCREINDFIKEKIAEIKPPKVFLQAYWNYYKEFDVVEVLRRTVKFIKDVSPLTEIVILGSVPQWEPTLPVVLMRSKSDLSITDYIYTPLYIELKKLDTKLATLATEEDIEFISILDNFCVDKKCLAVIEYKSKPSLTIFDNGHLTEAGSIFLFTQLKKSLIKSSNPLPIVSFLRNE